MWRSRTRRLPSGKSELEREFNPGKHGLRQDVLSGVEALERGFETSKLVVEQDLEWVWDLESISWRRNSQLVRER